jgi:hypothetical protein
MTSDGGDELTEDVVVASATPRRYSHTSSKVRSVSNSEMATESSHSGPSSPIRQRTHNQSLELSNENELGHKIEGATSGRSSFIKKVRFMDASDDISE